MKKIMSLILATLICIIPALAEMTISEEVMENTLIYATDKKSNEPNTVELERIIKIVKPLLNVPEECKEFNWHYNAPNYTSGATWNLFWYSKEFDKEVNVSCDDSGNIYSYSYYEYSNVKMGFTLPEYTKKELALKAEQFLKKLAPNAADSFKLISSTAQTYSNNFVYKYERYENDVVVPGNIATVYIDYVTGTPVRMNVNYDYDVTFEDSEKIDIAIAKQKLQEKQKMKLSYRLKSQYDEKTGELTGRTAYLIYSPEISYLSVDAKTAEVYTQRNTWTVAEKGDSTANGGALLDDMFAAESESSRDEEYVLSPEELAQLEVLSNLISRQQAIDTILKNEYLYIDENATAVEANLVQKNSYVYRSVQSKAHKEEKEYQWNLYFSAPYYESNEKNGYFSPYINAVVDAQTAEIISFSANVPGQRYYKALEIAKIPERKFTEDNATEIFKEFAGTVIPEKLKNTRVSDISEAVVYDYELPDEMEKTQAIYRSLSINLVRVNEGIDFTYNGIYGSVDRVTGKVTRFSYTWYDDVVFESPKDAITPEKAYAVMLDSDGFGLNYEINANYTYNQYLLDREKGYIDIDELYDAKKYTRLVYSGYNYASTTISALDGKLINYSGNPIEKKVETEYTDIDGHWAQDYIIKLADLGLGFEGETFKPDSFITLDEFVLLLTNTKNYHDKITPAEQDREKPLTRTDAVKYIIDSAGYYKIATLPDIFVTDFADNSELERDDVGFIAIARGLGLVEGCANEFRPYDNMTRAEAVTLIFKLVKLSN